MSKNLNVYLCGNKIGVLQEDERAQLSFQYDVNAASFLSVHLPVRGEPYPHIFAYPFFENLAPEGEAFDILTSSHGAGNKTFSILDRFGGDCAGAIALYGDKPVGNRDDKLNEITDAKLAHLIDNLPTDPLLTGMENPPRLSLAGAQ
jgi:serine/threonine-protein kinase HipA